MEPVTILAIGIAISLSLHILTGTMLWVVIKKNNSLADGVSDVVSAKVAMWRVVNSSSGESMVARMTADRAQGKADAAWSELKKLYASGIVIEVPRDGMH